MAGYITDFFGYPASDDSLQAQKSAAKNLCPFLHGTCSKHLSDGTISGACAIKQVSSDRPVICCPIRLYSDNYRILSIIAERTFGKPLSLFSGRAAIKRAKELGAAVAVFGHGWGGELRLPKREGTGNYFADWVLALIGEDGELKEFTSIEVQTIDTTGNYRDSRDALLKDRSIVKSSVGLNWENVSKRIIPQLVYKGQILQRESLCKSGLWFVTPEPVYQRILTRLGGTSNLSFGYAPQPGALHFLRYDYADVPDVAGSPLELAVTGEEISTVEKIQQAFANVNLPEPGVYGEALRVALYDESERKTYQTIDFF